MRYLPGQYSKSSISISNMFREQLTPGSNKKKKPPEVSQPLVYVLDDA